MVFQFSHKTIKRIVVSFLLSVCLVIIGYFVNNLPIFTGENLDQFFFTQYICEKLGISHKFSYDDAAFINVSYDKDLVPANGAGPKGILGNNAITDREKLYKFLKVLHDDGDYKYIVLDIMFDPKDISPSDSLLYGLIENMNNILIIRDDSIPVPSKNLLQKSALAYYFSTITATNFTRYEFLSSNNIPYIPLKIYGDIYPEKQMKRSGLKCLPFYTSDSKLCYNTCFICFDREEFSSFNKIDKSYSKKSFYNLGSDLVANPILKDDEKRADRILKLTKDKYVFVGNFTEDLHDTYMGVRPGPLILYRAFKTLEDNKHIVSFWNTLYWLLIFTFVFWLIFSRRKISVIFPSKIKHTKFYIWLSKLRFLNFIVSSVGYVTILFIFSTLDYIVSMNIYSIVFPSIVFSITKLYIDYKNF